MNKAELVKALEERLGERKTALSAVDGFIDAVVRAVAKGEKVSIAGFGVFEKRRRSARTARNPATGEPVKVKATSVPAFRAGSGFKDVVSGAKKLERPAKKTTTAKKTAAKATATKSATKSTARPATKSTTRSTAAKSSAAKSTAAKKTAAAKKTTATKTTAAKKTTAKKAPATKRTTATAAKKTTAKKTATKTTAAKKTTARKR